MDTDGSSSEVAVDVIVVGAGIVGLASARAVQLRWPDRSVLVLDKEDAPARHQTGRNSGVVHTGIYYVPGSAKAVLVKRGREMLRERCQDWGVPYNVLGKVVVAGDASQLPALDELERRARANEVEVHRLNPAGLREIEPHVRGIAALSVPGAAITDFTAVTGCLVDEIRADGGEVTLGAEVQRIDTDADGVTVHTAGDATYRAGWLVNCAGLHSDRVARLAGADIDVSIVPFRGDYQELTDEAVSLVKGLVYPVPDPRWPFLGVHFTPMINGGVHVGPTAVLALGREAYDRKPVPVDAKALLGDRGLWRLAGKYWRTGAGELLRARSPRRFLDAAQRLVPQLEQGDLRPADSGIRAQALDRKGRLIDDFAFADSPRCVHVLNAPSPAATASLAIGEAVAERLATRVPST